MTWLTPQRMKAITVALFIAAFCVSTIGLNSSSSPAAAHPLSPAHTAR
jgi:hypothetical protein